MLALVRNPFFRWIRRDWSLLALAVLVLTYWTGGAEGFLPRAFMIAGALIAGLAGIAAFVYGYFVLAGLSLEKRRKQRNLRFICPECLQSGGFHYACRSCHCELESLVVETRGQWVNDCPHCRKQVFHYGVGDRAEYDAYCSFCHVSCGADLFHEHRVRVVGAFHPDDLKSLQAEALACGAELDHRSRQVWIADDTTITLVVDLCFSAEDIPPRWLQSAAGQLNAVWLDAALVEPLELVNAVDRFTRMLAGPNPRWKFAPVCAASPSVASGVRSLFAQFGNLEVETTARGILFAGRGPFGVAAGQAPLPAFNLRIAKAAEETAAETGRFGQPQIGWEG